MGTVTIDTFGSGYNTTLGVYTGSAVTALTLVADNDDTTGVQSEVVFGVTAGTVYQIQVNGFGGASGSIVLRIVEVAAPTPPPNDDFAARITLSGSSVMTTGTNVLATAETGEPNPAAASGTTSVWWTWTATVTGTVTIDTFGSGYNTTLGVYTGSAVTALTLVADNDDTTGVQSEVVFGVTAGTVYQIQVNGSGGATGSIALSIVEVAAPGPPPNDDFAARITLSGSSVTTTGTNVVATAEAGEPNPAAVSGATSVWYTWTAQGTDTVTIDTFGSSYNTTLGVYTGSVVTALTPVAQNDDTTGLQSEVSFSAVAGTVYQIQVNGFAGASGNVVLNLFTPYLPPEYPVGLCGSVGVDLLIPIALLWMSRRIRKKPR